MVVKTRYDSRTYGVRSENRLLEKSSPGSAAITHRASERTKRHLGVILVLSMLPAANGITNGQDRPGLGRERMNTEKKKRDSAFTHRRGA
jgi:hypothetical protein